MFKKISPLYCGLIFYIEARGGFEPPNDGFANRSVKPLRHRAKTIIYILLYLRKKGKILISFLSLNWLELLNFANW